MTFKNIFYTSMFVESYNKLGDFSKEVVKSK